jgi:hypothetical protein
MAEGKSKTISKGERPDFFAQGGDGKMFGKGEAGEAEEGVSGKQSQTPSGGGDKWASGGTTKMFGKGHANKAEPGQSGKSSQ